MEHHFDAVCRMLDRFGIAQIPGDHFDLPQPLGREHSEQSAVVPRVVACERAHARAQFHKTFY